MNKPYRLTDFGVYDGQGRLCGWYSEQNGECRELADPGWGYCEKHRRQEARERKDKQDADQ